MNRFVIWINSEGNSASLILCGVYLTLPDAAAETHSVSRILDEDKSEPDDYLHPASIFAPIELVDAAMHVSMAGMLRGMGE